MSLRPHSNHESPEAEASQSSFPLRPAPFRLFRFLPFPLQNWLLLGAMLGYTGLIGFLQALRQARFGNGFDLAFYQQAIWNTTQGRFLEVSATDFSRSLLGTDVLLIYALMAPFYALFPAVTTLLWLETIVVALGALPVFWLAADLLKNRWAALALALTYLLLPAVQNANLYELRERPMGGAFLLFAFYYWQKGRPIRFGLFAALALTCRPENGLVLVMLGLYGWLDGQPRRSGRGWKYVGWPVGLGLGWFGAALLVIQAASGGQGYALGSTFAGGSPLAAVTTLFTDPAQGWRQLFPTTEVLVAKALYIPLLLLPLGFLPLFSPRLLLMALPVVGLNLLSGESRKLQVNPFDYHYQGAVVPWLLAATIFTLARWQAAPPPWLSGQSRRFTLVAGAALLVLALTLTVNIATNLITFRFEGAPNLANGWAKTGRTPQQPRWQAGKALLENLPPQAPVAVSLHWAPYLPPRRELYFLIKRPLYSMDPTRQASYVFADLTRQGEGEDAPLVQELLAGGGWREVARRENYILLQRR